MEPSKAFHAPADHASGNYGMNATLYALLLLSVLQLYVLCWLVVVSKTRWEDTRYQNFSAATISAYDDLDGSHS
jgi:hypothetical protein